MLERFLWLIVATVIVFAWSAIAWEAVADGGRDINRQPFYTSTFQRQDGAMFACVWRNNAPRPDSFDYDTLEIRCVKVKLKRGPKF